MEHYIYIYISLIKKEIEDLRSDQEQVPLRHPNLTANEIRALNELANNKNITIKSADKGGGVVIMDTENYVKEAKRQLGDTMVYRKLNSDPKWDFGKKLSALVDKAYKDGVIDGKLKEYLIVKSPVTPVLYLLPKIHKSLIDPPGRPIVSGRESIFNHASIFLDRLLREFAMGARSYIQDTNDFLLKLEEVEVPNEALLASFDVTSLYTSIDTTEGLQAVSNTLSETNFSLAGKEFVMNLLELILTCNYFKFGNDFYLQCRGTAMGANVAPTFANMFLAALEEDLIYVSHHFSKVARWWRYIDDVFLIWVGQEAELHDFHNFLNSINRTVKFTLVFSRDKLAFLDTMVILDSGKLRTELYQKPTDRNTLLHFKSSHPKRMVRSLPFSQLLRARRIIDVEEKWEATVKKMTVDFEERGFPRPLISEHAEKVQKISKFEARRQKRTKKQMERIPFVSTYTEESSRIGQVINKHWSILKDSFTQIPGFQKPPLLSYRKGVSLKDRLVKSEIQVERGLKQTHFGSARKGSFPCLSCVNCRIMQKGEVFTHPNTGKRYDLKHFLTCNSEWVVYIIWCPCKLLYVGETSLDLKTRLNQHRYTIRKKRLDLPVSKHCTESGHSEWDIRFMIVDHIPPLSRGGDRQLKLLKRELKWIFELGSLKPGGLNVDFKVSKKMSG